jgi:DNA-binding CsgD family transcriptional regulator
MDYADCEKMAKIVLLKNRQKLTDENIGIVIDFILRANHKYNKSIGNEFGFRKMYIQFALKSIQTLKKKRFKDKTIYIDDYSKLTSNKSYKDFNSNIFWEDLKKKLTPKEFSVIFSRVSQSKTLREIAEEQNFSIETARNYIKSAHRKIKIWHNS